MRLVPVHLILWAEARAGRVSVHSSEGQLTIAGTLASLTHALGAGFQQITRNTMVNMNAVAEIRRRSRQCESALDLMPPTARQRPDAVFPALPIHAILTKIAGRHPNG